MLPGQALETEVILATLSRILQIKLCTEFNFSVNSVNIL